MSDSTATDTQPQRKTDWLAVGLFGLGGFAAVGLIGAGLSTAFYGGFGLISDLSSPQGVLAGLNNIFAGLLLLVASFLALWRVIGRGTPRLLARRLGRNRAPHGLLLALPLILVAGHVVADSALAWLLLPPLHMLAVGFPLLWLVWLVQRKFPHISLLRRWGALASGLAFSPFLALVLELIAGFAVLFAGLMYVSFSPDVLFNVNRLFTRLSYGDPSPEVLTRILDPLASDPVLAVLFLGYLAVAVPFIEELVKPAAVMLLLRRPITVREGFVLGAITGAGFGLLENLTQGASVEGWAPLVVARLGTTAVHMVTAALTGAALVDAKLNKRYGRLLAAYLTAVAIHGLWNAMATLPLLAAFSESYPRHLAITPWMVLALLGIGSAILLGATNRYLRPAAAPLEAESG